jgi:hypothetical protein
LMRDIATSINPQSSGPFGGAAASELIVFAVARCQGMDDFDEFLSALAEQPDETRKDILEPFRANDYWANLLCGKVWLSESSVPSPDWTRCLALFERTIILGSAWGLNALVVAAYHALAVIQDEYLHEPEAALASLARGRTQLGDCNPVLENARAMVLFRSRRYQEALQIWEVMLPHWPQGYDTGPAFAYRYAEICAAEEGDWRRAARLARNGAEAAHRARLMVMATGLRADSAFALWKCGDTSPALVAFANVLEGLATLPDPQEDLAARVLYIRVGHAISWMLQESRNPASQAEPPAGYFSDQELHESYRDQPFPTVQLLWGNLAQVEYEIQAGETIFRRLEAECERSPTLETEFIMAHLRLRYHVRQAETNTLMTDAATFLTATERLRDRIEQGTIPLVNRPSGSPPLLDLQDRAVRATFITELLLAALVTLVSKNTGGDVPVEVWKAESRHLDVDETILDAWLDLNRSTEDWYTHAATCVCSSEAIFSTAAVTAGSW